jgi:hypothetical protein
MRIAICLLLLAFQIPATAVDFQIIRLGETCRAASISELSLGAKPRYDVDLMVNKGIVVFDETSIGGQRSRSFYDCTRTPGIVSRYSIDTWTDSEVRAWEIFAKAKASAVSNMGAPEFDSETPEANENLRRLRDQGSTSMHAAANWTTAEGRRAMIVIEEVPKGGEWKVKFEVSVDDKESPNKSLERTRER